MPQPPRQATGTEWMVTVPDHYDALPSLDDITNQAAMDDIITDGRNPHKREYLHASTVLKRDNDYKGNPLYCEREGVLSNFYHTNEVIHKPKTQMIFDNGWSLHQRWQRYFTNAGVAIEVELAHDYCYEGFDDTGALVEIPLEFTPDAAILFNNRPTIVEIKGYKQEEYFRLIKGKIPTDAYAQVQLYMSIYTLPDGSPIDHGLIIVENKNTQEYHMWSVERVSQSVEKVMERLRRLAIYAQMHAQTGHLPVPLCSTPTDPRAISCSLRDACFGIYRVPLKAKPHGTVSTQR